MRASVEQGDFVTALGMQKEARWGWSDEEGPAQWSNDGFLLGAGWPWHLRVLGAAQFFVSS